MRTWLAKHYGVLSAVAGGLGVAFILLAELGHVDWAKIIGALLITAGAVGLGTWYGLADPRRWPLQAFVSHWRRVIGIAAVLVLAAPSVIALFVAAVGVADTEGRSAHSVTVALGFGIAVVFAVIVIAATILSVKVINRAAIEGEPIAGETEGSSR